MICGFVIKAFLIFIFLGFLVFSILVPVLFLY